MAKKEGFGTWSMILGIIALVIGICSAGLGFIPFISICTCFSYPIATLCAIAAIILGIIALVAGKGKGKAMLGIILAIIYFVLRVIIFIVMLLVGIAFAGLGALGDTISLIL